MPFRTALAFALIAGPAFAADTAAPAITVATVTETVLRARVLASGLIAPVEEVQVQPLIEGQPIEVLKAEVGDTVAAGQVLARLSTATLDLQRSELVAARASAVAAVAQAEAQTVEARANADEARRVAERTAALRAQGASSTAAADTADASAASAEARSLAASQSTEAARAQVRLTDAQIANVDLQLSRTEVIAPVAGEVVERNALVGAIASAQTGPMFVLTRDGALELRAEVAEGDLLHLAPGQPATLNGALKGIVRLVEPRIDTQSRLGRVRITLTDATALRSGMFAEAEILTEERSAPAIPLTALGRDEEGAFVMLLDGDTLRRAAVTPGIQDGALIGVDLAPGARVVARAGAFVREGDRITAIEAAP